MQERRIDDYWNVDGSRDLSYSWTGFTQFTLLDKKPPDGYMWSRERLTKRKATSRPDHLWPELCTKLGRNAKLRKKQKWSMAKPKFDNAGRLRGIYFIDPGMLERNWKHQWLPLCLARRARRTSMGRPVARLMISSLSLHVSWKPVNPHDCVWKNLHRNIMRIILQEREGDNSLQHCNLVHKFIPMPLAMTIPEAKAAMDQEWEKVEKIPAWDLTKVRSKSEVIDEARKKGAKVYFASLMDICHLKNAELETKHQKYKGRVCTPRRYCGRWFWLLRSIHGTRITSISNDCSKSHGYHIQTARMRRTSSGRRICLYPGTKGSSKIIENSKIGISRHLDTSTTTQKAKIMVQYGRPSRSSWAKSARSSFGRTVFKKGNLRKSYWSTVGRRFPIGNAYSYTVKKDYSCLCLWMTSNWLEWFKILIRCGKYPIKKLIWENQHLSWSCISGVYSKTVWNKKRYCWQWPNHVWIQNFCRSNCKNTMLGKSAYFLVLWHGRACQEMCGTILWVGEQDDSTTLQSINCMHWWPSFQRRIVKSMLSNCSEMLMLGTYWKTWFSMVSEPFRTIDHKMDQSLARVMGSPRRGLNRRRRAREGPEPACVKTPLVHGWHTQGGTDELTSCRGTV